MMWIMFIIGRVVVAGMLVWALAQHPYGYYQLLRVVTTAVCVFGIYCAVSWKKAGWPWVFGILAVLFNPLVPIRLPRVTWNVIDIAVALFLIVSILLFRPSQPEVG